MKLIPLMLAILLGVGFQIELSTSVQAQTLDEIAAGARSIFERNCHRCHDGNGSTSGEPFDVSDFESIDEYGIETILDAIVAGRMPPENAQPRPTIEDINLLHLWIEKQTPAFPGPSRRKHVTISETYSAIVAYLNDPQRADPELNEQEFSPEFVRFFSF